MFSICKINKAEILFGPCPSQLVPLTGSIKEYCDKGITIIISLLEEEEEQLIGLANERAFCEDQGIAFYQFPITDRGIPSLSRLTQQLELFYALTFTHNKIYIHCKHGIGRSALLTASLMVRDGQDIKQVLETIASKRGINVPETLSQKKLLSAYYLALKK